MLENDVLNEVILKVWNENKSGSFNINLVRIMNGNNEVSSNFSLSSPKYPLGYIASWAGSNMHLMKI